MESGETCGVPSSTGLTRPSSITPALMGIIETFEPGCQPRLWPRPSIGLDSS